MRHKAPGHQLAKWGKIVRSKNREKKKKESGNQWDLKAIVRIGTSGQLPWFSQEWLRWGSHSEGQVTSNSCAQTYQGPFPFSSLPTALPRDQDWPRHGKFARNFTYLDISNIGWCCWKQLHKPVTHNKRCPYLCHLPEHSSWVRRSFPLRGWAVSACVWGGALQMLSRPGSWKSEKKRSPYVMTLDFCFLLFSWSHC